jgi:hypothetical protein
MLNQSLKHQFSKGSENQLGDSKYGLFFSAVNIAFEVSFFFFTCLRTGL